MPRSDPRSPLVSVITPAFNVASFIEAALDSALRQTVDDIEIVVVDDGSTDETARVAQRCADKDARIRLIQTPNRGVSRARNTAMEAARGRFFAFLDGDDEWLPDFLAAQLAIFERMPEAGVVSGNAWNRGGPLDGRAVRRWPAEVRELSVRDVVEHEDAVFIMSVFRREMNEAIGGIDPALRRSEDYDFWLRGALAGFRIVANPTPLGYYRRRAGSASADELAMMEAIREVLMRVRRAGVDNETGIAVDHALQSLDSRYLATRAKARLFAREYEAAARDFRALRHLRTGSARAAALAMLSTTCPALLRSVLKARAR